MTNFTQLHLPSGRKNSVSGSRSAGSGLKKFMAVIVLGVAASMSVAAFDGQINISPSNLQNTPPWTNYVPNTVTLSWPLAPPNAASGWAFRSYDIVVFKSSDASTVYYSTYVTSRAQTSLSLNLAGYIGSANLGNAVTIVLSYRYSGILPFTEFQSNLLAKVAPDSTPPPAPNPPAVFTQSGTKIGEFRVQGTDIYFDKSLSTKITLNFDNFVDSQATTQFVSGFEHAYYVLSKDGKALASNTSTLSPFTIDGIAFSAHQKYDLLIYSYDLAGNYSSRTYQLWPDGPYKDATGKPNKTNVQAVVSKDIAATPEINTIQGNPNSVAIANLKTTITAGDSWIYFYDTFVTPTSINCQAKIIAGSIQTPAVTKRAGAMSSRPPTATFTIAAATVVRPASWDGACNVQFDPDGTLCDSNLNLRPLYDLTGKIPPVPPTPTGISTTSGWLSSSGAASYRAIIPVQTSDNAPLAYHRNRAIFIVGKSPFGAVFSNGPPSSNVKVFLDANSSSSAAQVGVRPSAEGYLVFGSPSAVDLAWEHKPGSTFALRTSPATRYVGLEVLYNSAVVGGTADVTLDDNFAPFGSQFNIRPQLSGLGIVSGTGASSNLIGSLLGADPTWKWYASILKTELNRVGNTVFTNLQDGRLSLKFNIVEPKDAVAFQDGSFTPSTSISAAAIALSSAKSVVDLEGDTITVGLKTWSGPSDIDKRNQAWNAYVKAPDGESGGSFSTSQTTIVGDGSTATIDAGSVSFDLSSLVPHTDGTPTDGSYFYQLELSEKLAGTASALEPELSNKIPFAVVVDRGHPSVPVAALHRGSSSGPLLGDSAFAPSTGVFLSGNVADATSGIKRIILSNSPIVITNLGTATTIYQDGKQSAVNSWPQEHHTGWADFTISQGITQASTDKGPVVLEFTQTYYKTVDLEGLQWFLGSGPDGVRNLYVCVVDQAGNSFIQTLSTAVDTTVPTIDSTKVGHSYYYDIHDQKTLQVSWEAKDVVAGPPPSKIDATTCEIILDGSTVSGSCVSGTWTADVAVDPKWVPNAVIVTGIRATDRAGNTTTLPYYVYSPASTGHLKNDAQSSPGASAVMEDGTWKYKLTFSTKAGGIANQSYLSYQESGKAGATRIALPVGAASFDIKIGAAGNSRLTYKEVAVNASGDETYGDEIEFAIPNQAPAKPSLSSDFVHGGTRYLGSDTSTLKWNSVTDPEGDGVVYRVRVRNSAAGPWHDLLVATEGGSPVQTTSANEVTFSDLEALNGSALPGFFVDGAAFEWEVVADDSHQHTTESDPQNAIVDLSHPGLTISSTVSHGGVLYTGGNTGLSVAVTKPSGLFGSSASTHDVRWLLREGSGSGPVVSAGQLDLTQASVGTYAIDLLNNVSGYHPDGGSQLSTPLPVTGSGPYVLTVVVTDWSGHVTSGNQNIYVDHGVPGISLVSQERILTASDSLAISFNSQEQESGTASFEYRFVTSASAGAEPQVPWIGVAGNGWQTGSRTFSRTIDTSILPDGQLRYLELRATDQVGNASQVYVASAGILKDSRSPVATVKLVSVANGTTAPVTSIGSLLGLSTGALDLARTEDWNGQVPASTTVEYAIAPAGVAQPIALGDGSNWQTALTKLAAAPISNGQAYEFLVRYKTLTGAVSQTRSNPVLIDGRIPSGVETVLAPLHSLTTGDVAPFRFHVLTTGSAIVRSTLTIKDQTGSAVTSINKNGWTAGSLTITGSQAAFPAGTLSISDALPDGNYRISLEAEDAVGHVFSTATVCNITVDRSVRVVVADGGPFAEYAGAVRGEWQLSGNGTVTQWEYRLLSETGGVTSVTTDWQQGETSARVLSASLPTVPSDATSGVRYYWEVKVRLEGYDSDFLASSPGVRFDQTAPQVSGGSVPAFVKSPMIPVSVQARDDQSSISQMRAELVKDIGGDLVPVSDWMDLGFSSASIVSVSAQQVMFVVSGNPVVLDDGERYLVRLKVENKAGIATETILGSFVCDTTPPVAPIVRVGGGYFNPYAKAQGASSLPGDQYQASWVYTGPDAQSGSSYQWALTTDPQAARSSPESLNWKDSDPGLGVSLSYESSNATAGYTRWSIVGTSETYDGPAIADGSSLYLVVKATNGVGLATIGVSRAKVVDASAPRLGSVALLANGNGRPFVDPRDALTVEVSAVDEGSGIQSVDLEIETQSDLGQVQSLGLVTYQDASLVSAGQYVFGLDSLKSKIEALAEGSIVVIRATVHDEAGNEREVENLGTVIEKEVASISTSRVDSFMGAVDFAWTVDGAHSQTISDIRVSLVQGSGPPVATFTLSPGVRSYRFGPPGVVLSDGDYQVRLEIENRNGKASSPYTSQLIAVDASPAFFGADSTWFPKYVNDSLAFRLLASENLSSIVEYQYSLGSYTNQFAYQPDWTSVPKKATDNLALNPTLTLSSLLVPPADRSSMYVYYRVRNSAGLWSTIQQSPKITVDQTKPTVAVTSPAYTISKFLISGNAVEAVDAQSGVQKYRYRVVSSADVVTSLEGQDEIVATSDESGALKIPSFTAFSGMDLQDGKDYRVAIQVQNGAGTWSDIQVGASPIIVDLTDPVLSFSYFDPAFADHRLIVTNDGKVASLPYSMSDDVQTMDVYVSHFGSTVDHVPKVRPDHDLTVPFHPELSFNQPADSYGEYTITVHLVDKAGRTNEVQLNQDPSGLSSTTRQRVRVNAPPQFDSTGFGLNTTPGNPDSMSVADFSDSDGDDSVITVTALLTLPDNSTLRLEQQWSKETSAGHPKQVFFSHAFYMPNNVATGYFPEEVEYPVKFYLTDDRGKRSEIEEMKVLVANTKRGTLFANEYWGGGATHTLQGVVNVPTGIKLTVLPAVNGVGNVHVTPISLSESDKPAGLYNAGISVQGELELRPGSVVINDDNLRKWLGIDVAPGAIATANDAEIDGADRALTLESGSVFTLDGLKFDGGNIGIHLLGGTLNLADSQFSDLAEYGIKTETGASVHLTNSTFIDVPRVLYNSTPPAGSSSPPLGVISVEELNTLPGCSGNAVSE